MMIIQRWKYYYNTRGLANLEIKMFGKLLVKVITCMYVLISKKGLDFKDTYKTPW